MNGFGLPPVDREHWVFWALVVVVAIFAPELWN